MLPIPMELLAQFRYIIEHAQTEALLSFKEPLQISASVSGKF